MILEAIARGYTKLGEIKNYVGKEQITEYLKNLKEVELVERIQPLGSKRGFYRIKDNFTRFWFRYIHPNLSLIELGIFGADDIKKDYNNYLGEVFEKIAFQAIAEKIKREELPKVEKICKWIHKGQEIDIVGFGENIGIFCEVKWKELKTRDVYGVYQNLREKAKFFNVKEKLFVIFAKKAESVEEKDLKIFTLEDLFK